MNLNIIERTDVHRPRSDPYAERGPGAPAAGAGTPDTQDDLYSKVLKYVPAPLIGIYLFVQNLILSPDSPSEALAWIVLVVFLVLTVVYLRARNVKRPMQIGFSVLAFAAWAAATPGPFVLIDGWETAYGSIALALVAATLIAVKLPPMDPEPE